jgi:hypothetical protein
VCCDHRGHKPDRRGRAGIRFSDAPNFQYHCFNCQFKTGWRLGNVFTANLRKLLTWSGLDSAEIDRLALESLRERDQRVAAQRIYRPAPEFEGRELPQGARLLDLGRDSAALAYLASRGITADQYPFSVVDGESRERIIIPYYYGGRLVGYASRFYDGRRPKYVSEQQSGYVFNTDYQSPGWNVCVLVEGQFDAIAIGGCAYMGSNISDEQAQIISKLEREIIVVPDQDESGLAVCNRALELGYRVSIPNWSDDVKDVNDAVVKYGRLPTLISILQNATTSRIKIEMARKRLV